MKSLVLFLLLGFAKNETKKCNFTILPSNIEGDIVELYKAHIRGNSDIVITLDLPLYVYTRLIDRGVKEYEEKILLKELMVLLKALYQEIGRIEKVKCIDAGEGAQVLKEYLSVPLYFLSGDSTYLINEKVKKEVELINGHRTMAISPITGIREDYTQYIPRGHYTSSPKLKKYFISMLYLSRMGFKIPENVRTVNVLVYILNNSETVRQKYEFFTKAFNKLFGSREDIIVGDLINFKSMLCNSKPLQDTVLKILKKPKIISLPISEEEKKQGIEAKIIHFFAQRFTFDNLVFQLLTYDRVGTRKNPRLLPSGLDLQAVLGSSLAHNILKNVLHEDRFKNYTLMLDSLSKFVPQELKGSVFHRFLYLQYLYLHSKATSKLFTYDEEKYESKKLLTNLGSWSIFKYAGILYMKQSYTVGITFYKPHDLKRLVLVEPYPEIIKQLRELTEETELLFEGLKVEDDFRNLLHVLDVMYRLSLNQKEGEPSQEIMGEMVSILKSFPLTFSPKYTIIDVHTDPNSRKVLEVGIGKPLKIVYTLSNGRKAEGFMLSYYEFSIAMDKRFTSEQWAKEVRSGVKLPIWIGGLPCMEYYWH